MGCNIMASATARSSWSLSGLLDYFIPMDMLADAAQHRRARMFMLSHAFGPILGNSLPAYLYFTGTVTDARVLVFFLSILSFWIYPPLLRLTKRYTLLSFISLQNLALTVFWACYAFGGLLSPFLSWLLILPLLSFLYLPPVGWVRNALLTQMVTNVVIFMLIMTRPSELPPVALEQMQVIGLISMLSVAIYFAMMAYYFGKMFREQREFERELNALVSTSDNLRDLTSAAEHAGAAKADFIASMSHELRTPLNAIIGYSQLLRDEAEDEQDDEAVADLGQVYASGCELLSLIDDILDYSRIDAGRMPYNPSPARFDQKSTQWCGELASTLPTYPLRVAASGDDAEPLITDWQALRTVVLKLAHGLSRAPDAGHLELRLMRHADGFDLLAIDHAANGKARAIEINREMFEDSGDVSSTKYGSVGIELSLAHKFIELMGGATAAVTSDDRRPALLVRFAFDNALAARRRAA